MNKKDCPYQIKMFKYSGTPCQICELGILKELRKDCPFWFVFTEAIRLDVSGRVLELMNDKERMAQLTEDCFRAYEDHK